MRGGRGQQLEAALFLTLSIVAHLLLLLLFLRVPTLSVATLLVYGSYHGLAAWGVLHPRSRLFGPNRSRLTTSERAVALTFDDGPHPEVTPRVLEILRTRDVRATFFVIGSAVRQHPEIVRQIVLDGHGVGNHSDRHSYGFWALPPWKLLREVGRAQRTIEAITGTPCRWFRAPVGMKSCFLRSVLRRQHLELVSWNVRFLERGPLDRARMERRLRRVVPGSILMLHDGHDRRPEGRPAVLLALPLVLDVLREKGYRCVPLE